MFLRHQCRNIPDRLRPVHASWFTGKAPLAAGWYSSVWGRVVAVGVWSLCKHLGQHRITSHSSRTRFVASFKCVVGDVVSASGPHRAGRLNSGVIRLLFQSYALACSFGTSVATFRFGFGQSTRHGSSVKLRSSRTGTLRFGDGLWQLAFGACASTRGNTA